MKVFCIIPAYNEEKTIAQIAAQVKPLVWEVVVVDDGSIDKTSKLAKNEKVTVLRHPTNRGQGAALETGNRYALKKGADTLVHFDADGQFSVQEIKDVIRPIQDGQADVVFGSRFLGKKSNMPGFKKNIIIPLAHLVNKILMGKTLSDPQSGFRALSRTAAQKIKIQNDGMAHCSEILYKTFKNNFRIQEVPITVTYHEFGQRLSGGFKIIKDLFLAKLID